MPNLEWSARPPTQGGIYLIANPLILPLKPYPRFVTEADGVELAGLAAGLWFTWGSESGLVRVEDAPVIWFGPIPSALAEPEEESGG